MSQAKANINVDPNTRKMTVEVDLSTEDSKVLAYGALQIAFEQCMRFFAMEDMKKFEMQKKMGLLKPITPDLVS